MKKITATFDADSKRFHRFVIDEGQGIVGNVYVPKGEDVPDEITIILKTRGEDNSPASRVSGVPKKRHFSGRK